MSTIMSSFFTSSASASTQESEDDRQSAAAEMSVTTCYSSGTNERAAEPNRPIRGTVSDSNLRADNSSVWFYFIRSGTKVQTMEENSIGEGTELVIHECERQQPRELVPVRRMSNGRAFPLQTSTWINDSAMHIHESPSMLTAESLSTWSVLLKQDRNEEALTEAFDFIDRHGTGKIEREELAAFLEEAAGHMKLDTDYIVINAAVDFLMRGCQSQIEKRESAATPQYMTKEQWFRIFRHNPGLYRVFDAPEQRLGESYSSGSISKGAEQVEHEQVWQHSNTNWHNRKLAILWVVLYGAALTVTFCMTANKWAHEDEATAVFGSCIVIARSAAQTLNLNAALVLLPVSRHLMTKLRFLKLPFPFDASLDAHMLVALSFSLFVLAHVCAHICDYYLFTQADTGDLLALFGDKLGEVPDSGMSRFGMLMKQRATITGIIMVICLVAAYAAIPGRRKRFNRFWYLHHLLILMLILMCVHGTGNLLQGFQSVYWVCGPLLLYLIPRIQREVKCNAVKVLGVKILDDIVDLRLSRPAGWDRSLRAGMYVFVNIPEVSRFEWHPFSLSSCPTDNFLRLNIRACGDWTKSVLQLMENCSSAQSEDETETGFQCEASITSFREEKSADNEAVCGAPTIRVDGPFGAPSNDFRNHAVVVLVGGGMGVAPMISIIQNLLVEPGKMRQAFFFWIGRTRSAFELFSGTVKDIFEQDTEKRLQIRPFLTSAKFDDQDLGSVLFELAADSIHASNNMDIVLGHKCRELVQLGRPDWNGELNHIKEIAKSIGESKCGIFVCGPQPMADSVSRAATRLSEEEKDFHFIFSKETF